MSSFVSRLISQLVGRWDRTSQSGKAAAVSAPASSLLPRRAAMALLSASLLGFAVPAASAKGAMPEDILKGGLFISDSSFPTKWTSPQAFAAQVKKQHKNSLTYDKKTGKVQVYYAAFFAQPVNDIQVNFVIYDVTANPRVKKGSWEAFLGRKGERALFNSVELDKEDIEMNKKYMFAVEYKGKILASGQIIILGEKPKFSGKVDFNEEDTKKKE